MTRKNYEEMKLKKATTVFIPVDADSDRNNHYTVPLIATIFHHEPVMGCVINIPNSTATAMRATFRDTHMSRMAYSVGGDLLEKSGVYTYTCSGRETVGDRSSRKILSVSLHLKFVTGTPISNLLGYCAISCYSTCKMTGTEMR